MRNNISDNALIRELLANPSRFNEQGKAYELLQEYFRGYPIDTLRVLLRNQDWLVKRAAIWIVSELGAKGCPLLNAVIPLIGTGDRYIEYHALESATVCSIGKNAHQFAHVVRSLESDDEVIRVLVMRLISRADQSQLQAVVRVADISSDLDETHRTGINRLLGSHTLEPSVVVEMINDTHRLARTYGAIIARRLVNKFPELIAAAEASADPEVSRFAREPL